MIRQIYRYYFFSALMFLGMTTVFAQKRQLIILKDNWFVKEITQDEKFPGQIPGDFSKAGSEWYKSSMPRQVQELVFEKNKLPDPHYGDNAAKWTSVFDQDWVYTTRFASPEEDLWPKDFSFRIDKPGKIAWPAGWNKHTPGDGWLWIGPIENYLDIRNVEDAIRVLGTAQGDYTKERYERQRRGVPEGKPDGNRRSWGAMIWRLNDSWPIVFMSVVDYYLEPKIPYYFLKRACSPVLISFEQTTERICTWVVNDSPETINDSLIVEIRRFDGRMRSRKAWKVEMQPGQSKRVTDLTCFHDISKRGEFIVARMGNQVVTHLLCSEKYLYLPDAEIKAVKTGQSITLSSAKLVKEVELSIEDSSGAVFSDNYFNLIPGESRTVKILNMPDGGKTLRIKGVNSSITTLSL